MRSTFFGVEMGRRALQTQQTALDATGHNIANANTEGYSRQRAVLEATTPFAYPGFNSPLRPGQVGTGVAVKEINRMRNDFIDSQVRKESTTTGEWQIRKETLDKLEIIINEPSDSGLRTALDEFWQSWQTLSTRPEDGSVRATVRQRGIALAETFNHIDSQLADVQDDLDQSVEIKVGQVNNIAAQIASLNSQIVKIEVSGDHANDLRDKRDLLIDQLSKMVNTTIREDQIGSVTVAIGSKFLVSGETVEQLEADPVLPPSNFFSVTWASDGTTVDLTSGELQGLLYSRDTIVPDLRTPINDLAAQFITSFNTQHQLGYGLDNNTAYSFFAGTDAGTIEVDTDIDDLDHIAAAAGPAPIGPGDNANALLLVELKHDITTMGTASFDDYYRGLAGQLGVDSESATKFVDNQNLLLTQLDAQKQQLSGVSLDEEMTDMIKFQHAYNAASRVVTAMDEMLETIISRMGLAGR